MSVWLWVAVPINCFTLRVRIWVEGAASQQAPKYNNCICAALCSFQNIFTFVPFDFHNHLVGQVRQISTQQIKREVTKHSRGRMALEYSLFGIWDQDLHLRDHHNLCQTRGLICRCLECPEREGKGKKNT